jgi:hypothetical protein
VLAGAARPDAFEPQPREAAGMKLVVRDDFERDEVGPWEPTDPSAWRITRDGGNRVLDQFRASKYEPKVRSPFNYALARGVDLGDFVLDLKVRSTAPDIPQRDICLIFGHQDPSHFYYAHIAKKADDHHNNLFVVDGQPRAPIGESRTNGSPWTDGWHHVRVVRTVADGLIQVFFDDMTTPALTAHDKRFTHGRVGLGSFDDTAQFDSVQVWGAPASRPDGSR